ncbi:MAG: hypothetical protein SF028_09560 [Candidatus Sumerlaeia bacterium]|nr:hypothetical protein [Candidatus Sumerlaeia bacterium]
MPMRAATAAALLALAAIAPAQETVRPDRRADRPSAGPVAVRVAPLELSIAADDGFYRSSVWEGAPEVADYDAETVTAAGARRGRVELRLGRGALSRETRAEAGFPRDPATAEDAMRLRVSGLPADFAAPAWQVDFWAPLAEPRRVLRSTYAASTAEGPLFTDAQAWRTRPAAVSHGPRFGTREHPLSLGPGAVLEEALPLVLRALRFEDGLSAYTQLAEPLARELAGPPTTSPAIIKVRRPARPVVVPGASRTTGEAWEVAVEAEDGRRLRFVFDDSPTRTLLRYEDDRGTAWRLRSVSRR